MGDVLRCHQNNLPDASQELVRSIPADSPLHDALAGLYPSQTLGARGSSMAKRYRPYDSNKLSSCRRLSRTGCSETRCSPSSRVQWINSPSGRSLASTSRRAGASHPTRAMILMILKFFLRDWAPVLPQDRPVDPGGGGVPRPHCEQHARLPETASGAVADLEAERRAAASGARTAPAEGTRPTRRPGDPAAEGTTQLRGSRLPYHGR